MDGADADALLGQGVDLGQVLVRHVAAAAVGIHDDGRRVGEDRRILGPAVVLRDDGLDGEAALVEVLGQEHAAAQMLVVAVAVARPAGDKDDLLFLVLERGRGGRDPAAESDDGQGDQRAHGESFRWVRAG